MRQYGELKKSLQDHLNWHGARLSFLTLFLLALIKVKTANLVEISLGFGGLALPESSCKRLQRFFSIFELGYAEIAKVVVSYLQIPTPWVLSLD